MRREAVGYIALLFAVLASAGNALNAFVDIDGAAWDAARFGISVIFTLAGLTWLAMTLRERRGARRPEALGPMATEEGWQAWVETLPKKDRARAEDLLERFSRAGAPDPEGWTRSEISENIPQLARWTVLATLYREAVQPWIEAQDLRSTFPVAAALRDEGASEDRLNALSGAIAAAVFHSMLYWLHQGAGTASDPEAPGWALMEVTQQGELTGREIAALHESELEVFPAEEDGLRVMAGEDPRPS